MSSTSRGATAPEAENEKEAQGEWGGQTGGVGNYADVNGIKLYYEILGTGHPLILLHGGLGASSMFGPNLPALAKGRQVIAVDLQGDGPVIEVYSVSRVRRQRHTHSGRGRWRTAGCRRAGGRCRAAEGQRAGSRRRGARECV